MAGEVSADVVEPSKASNEAVLPADISPGSNATSEGASPAMVCS